MNPQDLIKELQEEARKNFQVVNDTVADGVIMSTSHLDTLISTTVNKAYQALDGLLEEIDEEEATFKDDPDKLLAEGYSIGYNHLARKIKEFINKVKEI